MRPKSMAGRRDETCVSAVPTWLASPRLFMLWHSRAQLEKEGDGWSSGPSTACFQERRRCEREGENREAVEIEEEEELAPMHTDRNEWVLKGYATQTCQT